MSTSLNSEQLQALTIVLAWHAGKYNALKLANPKMPTLERACQILKDIKSGEEKILVAEPAHGI